MQVFKEQLLYELQGHYQWSDHVVDGRLLKCDTT